MGAGFLHSLKKLSPCLFDSETPLPDRLPVRKLNTNNFLISDDLIKIIASNLLLKVCQIKWWFLFGKFLSHLSPKPAKMILTGITPALQLKSKTMGSRYLLALTFTARIGNFILIFTNRKWKKDKQKENIFLNFTVYCE